MASGTADLQRDLGGALMQSILGAILAIGYAAGMATALAGSPDALQVPASVTSSLEMSYAGAQTVAAQYPKYAAQIASAAKCAFLAGDTYSYLAGIMAVLIGAVLVMVFFPKLDKERELLAAYHAEDVVASAGKAE
jgi:MFS transporter, DHA2 family, multidrug resistance protein